MNRIPYTHSAAQAAFWNRAMGLRKEMLPTLLETVLYEYVVYRFTDRSYQDNCEILQHCNESQIFKDRLRIFFDHVRSDVLEAMREEPGRADQALEESKRTWLTMWNVPLSPPVRFEPPPQLLSWPIWFEDMIQQQVANILTYVLHHDEIHLNTEGSAKETVDSLREQFLEHLDRDGDGTYEAIRLFHAIENGGTYWIPLTFPCGQGNMERDADGRPKTTYRTFTIDQGQPTCFFIEEGWRIYAGESWKEAKKRLTETLKREITKYKRMMKAQNAIQEFKDEHFEWLVRRVLPISAGVNHAETVEDICAYLPVEENYYRDEEFDIAIISKETQRLAGFTKVNIPSGAEGKSVLKVYGALHPGWKKRRAPKRRK